MASDSDLWLSIKAAQNKYQSNLEVTKESPNSHENEEIVVTDIKIPPALLDTHLRVKKSPTPSDKRVLNQEDFDQRLMAKRASFFKKGRSLSLASFTNPVKRKIPKLLPLGRTKTEKSACPGSAKGHTSAKKNSCPDQMYLQENKIQGELEILGLESVIDVSEIRKK